MARVNLPVLALAVVWWLIETSYFGWHAFPANTPELFADGLALTLAAVAFLFAPKRRHAEARATTAAPPPLLPEEPRSSFESRQAKWEQAASLLDELGQPGMAMSARGFAIIERQVHEKQAAKVVPLRGTSPASASSRELR